MSDPALAMVCLGMGLGFVLLSLHVARFSDVTLEDGSRAMAVRIPLAGLVLGPRSSLQVLTGLVLCFGIAFLVLGTRLAWAWVVQGA